MTSQNCWWLLRKFSHKAILGAVYIVVPFSSVLACGGIFDVKCNLENGGLSPDNIAKQAGKAGEDLKNQVRRSGQDVADALNELQASVLSGPTLEQAIIASRNSAINGSRRIPFDVRQKLTGYASEDSMNRVRYKIGDNGFVNLARLLEQSGFASAVTLIDVIVFRTEDDAANYSTWAHELTHVDQYAAGTRSFAVRYARNYEDLEDPAYAKGNDYDDWYFQRSNTPPPFTPVDESNFRSNPRSSRGFPSGYFMQACGCWGPGATVASEPRCASGTVRANFCSGGCLGGITPYAYLCQ